MGCSCCKVFKSSFYDPSVPAETDGSKQDLFTNSLAPPYQSHRLPDEVNHKKEGFQNLGYASSPSGKPDIDNNHINRLHANSQATPTLLQQPTGGDSSLYILQPEGLDGTAVKVSSTQLSAPTTCTISMLGTEPGQPTTERFRDSGLGNGGMANGSDGYLCGQEDEEAEEGERRERTTLAPEYLGDTADEESVISVDIHTSSTSLSSADTKLVEEDEEERDPSLLRSDKPVGKEEVDCTSITDSMVAEALATLDTILAEFE